MDCGKANSQLSALASGSLATEDEAELRTHLESCEDCSFEFEKLCGGEPSSVAASRLEEESVLDVAPLAPPDDEALPETPVDSPAPPVAAAPPTAAAPVEPSTSDWTVEKIFGDGPGPSAPPAAPSSTRPHAVLTPPPAPAPPAVPAPSTNPIFPTSGTSFHDVALPMTPPAPAGAPAAPPSMAPPPLVPSPGPTSMIPPLPAASDPPAGKKAGKEGWDFEPADAARDATPPEESLLFAEQALQRRLGDSNRKNAALRMVLWGGGAVLGVGLLGVSLWMAMENRGPQTREIAARVKPSAGASTTVTHSVPGGGAPADSTAVAPGSDEQSPAPSATPEAPATASETSAPVPIKSGLAPGVGAPPKSAPAAGRTSAATAAKTATPATKTKATAGSEKQAASATPPPVRPLVRDDDEMWPVDDPVTPAPAAPKGSASAKPPTAAIEPPPPPSSGPVSETGAAGSDAPPASDAPSADLKPMDRIHAATEQAAREEDLEALRRLKLTWKNLTRTVVGPTRSRAKREFADCLWHIQALTGRDSDQREALLAYRDFLISAPAGGADARSAARLRELEDALAERR